MYIRDKKNGVGSHMVLACVHHYLLLGQTGFYTMIKVISFLLGCLILVDAQRSLLLPRVDYVDNGAPTPYQFSYTAPAEGGSSSRQESGDGNGRVTGSYTVDDVDGRSRIVEYVADEDGFRASISTNEPGTASQNPADVTIVSSADDGHGGSQVLRTPATAVAPAAPPAPAPPARLSPRPAPPPATRPALVPIRPALIPIEPALVPIQPTLFPYQPSFYPRRLIFDQPLSARRPVPQPTLIPIGTRRFIEQPALFHHVDDHFHSRSFFRPFEKEILI